MNKNEERIMLNRVQAYSINGDAAYWGISLDPTEDKPYILLMPKKLIDNISGGLQRLNSSALWIRPPRR
jgi:hypothetical protein